MLMSSSPSTSRRMTALTLLLVASMLLLDQTSAFVAPTSCKVISKPRQKTAHVVLISSSPVTVTRQVRTSLHLIDPSSTLDIAASVDNVLDDTSLKLLLSIGLAAVAIAGAFLVDQSGDGTDATSNQSLDAKYTDPDQLKAEYKAREEALQLAMEREAELALAEERGEYNKTQADAEMVSWKMAEGGSDPGGIQSSLPQEEERRVREMIAEQRRLEEEGAFDDNDIDAVSSKESMVDNKDKVKEEDTIPSTAPDVDITSADPLTLVQMMEKAKAQDEAAGKTDVAARIADKDSDVEQQARNILAAEFAAMEEVQDRARQEKEEKRIADLKEGQRLLDLMSQTRQTEVDQLQSLMQQQKEDIKREAEASQLEDDRLKMELSVAKGRYGMNEGEGGSDISDSQGRNIPETDDEVQAKAEAQQQLEAEKERYLAEVAAQRAREEVERKLEEEADELEEERLKIEEKAGANRQLKDDERTNQELNEALKLASNTPTSSAESQATVSQILEAERAVQVEKRRIALEEFSEEMDRQKAAEAERARLAERERAADIAKAQIERDMAMVRKYNEERKAKAAEAVAAADDKKRAQMASTTVEEKKVDTLPTITTDTNGAEKDIPEDVWVSEEEESILEEAKVSTDAKRERKRDKVAKLVKNKKVVGAGVAYMVGKKLLNALFL